MDFLYLIWKALDFEQLFECINEDNDDQVFKLFDFMNEARNETSNEEELF